MRALLGAALLLAACGPRVNGPVGEGSTVVLDYRLFADGSQLESSAERGEPLTITLGEGGLPERVERALIGLKPGDEKTLELPPELGFGPRDESMVQTMPLSSFGDLAPKLKVGSKVQGARGGKAAEARVTALGKKDVTLDFNHPLAGKRLLYRLKVLTTRSR